jgi:NAD(P)-dependent dehydrogenase (short-subunit alcohol dehydrogenase family)
VYESISQIKQPPMTVALVTGTSMGIGFATALLLASKGCKTSASMRGLGKANRRSDVAHRDGLPLDVTQLDVVDEASMQSTVSEILHRSGRIDVLVNNAGIEGTGPVELFDMARMRDRGTFSIRSRPSSFRRTFPTFPRSNGYLAGLNYACVMRPNSFRSYVPQDRFEISGHDCQRGSSSTPQ